MGHGRAVLGVPQLLALLTSEQDTDVTTGLSGTAADYAIENVRWRQSKQQLIVEMSSSELDDDEVITLALSTDPAVAGVEKYDLAWSTIDIPFADLIAFMVDGKTVTPDATNVPVGATTIRSVRVDYMQQMVRIEYGNASATIGQNKSWDGTVEDTGI